MHTTLISPSVLADHIADPQWVIVDCRFSLNDSERGRRDYTQGHIPHAVYAHLNEDLSDEIVPDQTGRHPLPSIEKLTRIVSNWGINSSVQVVAYDDSGGAMAARLWWLLKWLGHEAVAVLDGGWQQWQKEDYPITNHRETSQPRTFTPHVHQEFVYNASDVLNILNNPNFLLLDARAPERYRGEQEPIDPVGGHIPGALCAPYTDNLDREGRFLSAEELQSRFQGLLKDIPPAQTIFYCGSGVTAAHNLLALAHAGLGAGRLYAGSWSEWITDPGRPIAKGDR